MSTNQPGSQQNQNPQNPQKSHPQSGDPQRKPQPDKPQGGQQGSQKDSGIGSQKPRDDQH
jgi:hypothetical protein